MIYPKSIYSKLGFDQITELTAKACETERARHLIPAIRFSDDQELIEQRLHQTQEMKLILEESVLNVPLPIDFKIDSKEANAIGFFFTEEQFIEFLDALRSIEVIATFFKEHEAYPELVQLFASIDIDFDIIKSLDKSFDIDGQLKPNASKKLERITSQLSKAERQILKESKSLFQKHKELGYLADTELSIKDGRVVLPVLSEHKRKVEGLLIDQSSTAKISYIEPIKLVHLNNDLAELHIERRQEVVAILRNLTKQLLPELHEINSALRKLAVFDLIRAKARLSIDHDWVLPKLDDKEHVIINGKHPILQIKLKQEEASLVPLDLNFSEEQRLVVISGPNAGGKSVALKTVGLLQLMLQSGYLIPVDEQSSFKCFDSIFVDIGDDQSIESDLSTYSSHLKSAKQIVNYSDEKSLVLVDEIGTGTDPMFGGPMAQAIVEEIHNNKAYGVITTHFSNIKSSAKALPLAVNAAMLFDTENLVPLYKLSIGQAGSSFAYEVAKTIGLNKSVIKKAKSYTDTRQYDLDLLLAEVQQQRERLASDTKALEKHKSNAELYEKEYHKLKEELEKQKNQILKKAKKTAENIIDASNKEVERTIRTIKEQKADKSSTQKVRKQLETLKEGLKEKESAEIKTKFKVGDRVQIKDTNSIGEITKIEKNKVELEIGALKTKTKLDKIQKVGAAQKKKVSAYIGKKEFVNRAENFSSTLDVRGLRTEEALREVERWVDSALILGIGELKLVHGKGFGILKKQIRAYLNTLNIVESITYETEQMGGEGVSLIKLK